MKSTAFIFARGGSKGLQNKNLLDFYNNPLIVHTIKNAIASDLFNDVVVSTDSKDIANVATEAGASVPFIRPKNLATDDSNEWLSWKHAIENYNKSLDCFISIPCTCPLRDYKEVDKMIEFYRKNEFDAVVGIVDSNHSPDFNMVDMLETGQIKIINDGSKINRRQDANKCYIITTYAYITKPEYILNSNNLFDGKIGGYKVTKQESIDIDDKFDFEFARHIYMKHKKNNGIF